MPINKNCPWSGKKIQADSLTQYKGHQVGFCNTGCRDKFEKAIKLFDAEIDDCDYGLAANFRRFAKYNQWINKNLYKVVGTLEQGQFERDRGAFFGSIQSTLNHIMVWDRSWLQRMAAHTIKYQALDYVLDLSKPQGHKHLLYKTFEDLYAARLTLDDTFMQFCDELKESDLATTFSYKDMAGKQQSKNFGGVLQQVFNHQTHHRGQISTMLAQMDLDMGATDFLLILGDKAHESL
jgi:uncharacterized damage-inducible protein DinB